MISSRAQAAFHGGLEQAASATLSEYSTGGSWSMEAVGEDLITDLHKCMILCLCSVKMRIFVTVHFTGDIDTKQFVADLVKGADQKDQAELFYDFFKELCNVYAGHLKRSLSDEFPEIAFSTPDCIDRQSVEHFGYLNYKLGMSQRATAPSGLKLGFGIYVCPIAEIDFSITMADNSDAGELELF